MYHITFESVADQIFYSSFNSLCQIQRSQRLRQKNTFDITMQNNNADDTLLWGKMDPQNNSETYTFVVFFKVNLSYIEEFIFWDITPCIL